MALITLFVLVPSYTPPSANPARMPLLVVLVGLVTLMSVVSYNTASIGALGTVVGVGNGIIAIWGWWVIVFGLGKGYRSNKTVSKFFPTITNLLRKRSKVSLADSTREPTTAHPRFPFTTSHPLMFRSNSGRRVNKEGTWGGPCGNPRSEPSMLRPYTMLDAEMYYSI
jgi:hypothetical protein